MGRFLDIIALMVLLVAIAIVGVGLFAMGNREDALGFFCLLGGTVLLRTSVDLLRPRRSG